MIKEQEPLPALKKGNEMCEVTFVFSYFLACLEKLNINRQVHTSNVHASNGKVFIGYAKNSLKAFSFFYGNYVSLVIQIIPCLGVDFLLLKGVDVDGMLLSLCLFSR